MLFRSLLGGKDKGYAYEPLFEAIRNSSVVHTVLYGENAFRILNAALKKGYASVTLCRPFDLAVKVAYLTAKRGQNVLLSPASASFDSFRNYEERGERFAELVASFGAGEPSNTEQTQEAEDFGENAAEE